GALGDRIRASGSRLVFTTDVTYRKGRDVPLLGIVDDALEAPGHCVERVIVLPRDGGGSRRPSGRELTWSEFIAHGAGQRGEAVPMEANEPAYILATSGTTAKPKLTVHTHGAYQVYIHSLGRW